MVTTTGAIDTELEQAIVWQLGRHVGPELRDLGVIAIGGRICLCGEASSYANKKRAAELAATINGVRSVVNQIRVTPS
jgi:osmotically-inducible protein OsmY